VITKDQIIDDIFRREGDAYGDQTTTPPIDQPTARGGITLQVLQEFYDAQALGTATVDDLKRMTHEQARIVVWWKRQQLARQHGLDRIAYEPLQLQLIDFAYNSGPGLAIRWLQRVLEVPRTGKMDQLTIDAAEQVVSHGCGRLLHHALGFARLLMIDLATDPGGKVEKRFEEGLENRALSFSLLPIP